MLEREKNKKKALPVFYYWGGFIPFEKSLKIQEELKACAKQPPICFFGFESQQPVISHGVRSHPNHILWSEKKLIDHDISLMNVKRGGSATLHSPGQLVIYPVLHLPLLSFKLRDWIKVLEDITEAMLKDLGVFTHREGKDAGLYTKKGKICFFGIHLSQGVSHHGLSINVNNDLSLFSAIKSCGEEKRSHDKLSFYSNVSLVLSDLFFKWCNKALDVLNKRNQGSSLYQIKHPASGDFLKIRKGKG